MSLYKYTVHQLHIKIVDKKFSKEIYFILFQIDPEKCQLSFTNKGGLSYRELEGEMVGHASPTDKQV